MGRRGIGNLLLVKYGDGGDVRIGRLGSNGRIGIGVDPLCGILAPFPHQVQEELLTSHFPGSWRRSGSFMTDDGSET